MFGRFIKNVDAFRSLPTELTEATLSGGWLSIAAYVLMAILFVCELHAFLTPKTTTTITMDIHQADMMEIHFDITMHKLPCTAADVIVWDTFRESPLPITSKSVTKRNIDFVGNEVGVHEEADHIADYLVKHEEEHPEFDKDWEVSSPAFAKFHFDDVIKYHDFTFLNFYAEWCVHCRQFAPTWNDTERTTDKMQFKDGDGNVVIAKLLKINCVEFPTVCRDQGIRWYPSLRLYKRDMSFTPFKGDRKKPVLIDYLQNAIRNSHHILNKDHRVHEEGCRLEGAIRTLRVPGEFHIQAMEKTVDLEPSMTNVTHTVHSLIFLDDGQSFIDFLQTHESQIPAEVLRNAQPFAGKTFTAFDHHDAPQHFVQVVSTVFELKGADKVTIYQTSSQSQIKKEYANAVPQAKFTYQLSPMSVLVHNEHVPLYEFLTQIFAIIGGTYTVISLLHGFVGTVTKRYKTNIGKLG